MRLTMKGLLIREKKGLTSKEEYYEMAQRDCRQGWNRQNVQAS